MDFQKFSSDSTYCSLYENKKQSGIKKCRTISKLTNSKFLDKVHEEVIFHLEGTRLMGRVEVIHYLKRLSKIKLNNPKDQYFARKIQSSLLKIYNLANQFEETLCTGNPSPLLYPMESNTFTEDFKIFNVQNEDPKQILLRSTSVNDDISSFPFEMLTNHNFISSSCQNDKIESNNSDINSEISETYLKTLSIIENTSTQHTDNTFSGKENVHSSVNCAFQYKEMAIDPNLYSDNIHSSNVKDHTESKNWIESFINTADSEEFDTIQQLSQLCGNLSITHQSNISTVSESTSLKSEGLPIGVKKFNLKTVTDIGNNLNTNKIWDEIESNLTSNEILVEKVHSTLENMFDKLHTDEIDTNATHFITTMEKKDFHNFSEDDNKKLCIQDVMSANLNRLEQIYNEFQILVNSKPKVTEKHVEIHHLN